MYKVLFISSDLSGRKPLKSALLEQGFGVAAVDTR